MASKIHALLGTLSPAEIKVLRFTDAFSNALPLKYVPFIICHSTKLLKMLNVIRCSILGEMHLVCFFVCVVFFTDDDETKPERLTVRVGS